MNLPNSITLSRIPLMFIIVGLMYGTAPGTATLAFLLFLAAAVGDWLDGYIARRRGLVTTFGKLMDALIDKIMVLGLIMALVARAQIPLWLALITLCREFLVTGMRMVAASKGVIASADRGGKSKTLTQLIALGFLIGEPMVVRDWPYVLPWNLAGFAVFVHWTGEIVFYVGTALAVWSGWRYIVQLKDVVLTDADR